jgi:predicted ester cyclase
MSTEVNKANMRRFFEEVFNEKRLDRADEFVAQDYLDHAAVPGQGPGLEAAKQQRWARYFAAIPDIHATIDAPLGRGGQGGGALHGRGHPAGELLGIPPTGKRFRISDICIYRLAEGKVAENWEQADLLGLMQQLGVVPARGSAN